MQNKKQNIFRVISMFLAHKKTTVFESLFYKVKIRLQHWCFLVNIAKFLRAVFLINIFCFWYIFNTYIVSQPAITCSKLTTETLEQGEICSKLTIKMPERRYWRRSGIFIVNFEHISHLALVFLLLTSSR